MNSPSCDEAVPVLHSMMKYQKVCRNSEQPDGARPRRIKNER